MIILRFAAVFCDANAIPPFVNGTEVGKINWEDQKLEDPERWNAFRSRLTYTCPVGFVIESPGHFNEQPEPIPETQEEFEVVVVALLKYFCLRWNVRKTPLGGQFL